VGRRPWRPNLGHGCTRPRRPAEAPCCQARADAMAAAGSAPTAAACGGRRRRLAVQPHPRAGPPHHQPPRQGPRPRGGGRAAGGRWRRHGRRRAQGNGCCHEGRARDVMHSRPLSMGAWLFFVLRAPLNPVFVRFACGKRRTDSRCALLLPPGAAMRRICLVHACIVRLWSTKPCNFPKILSVITTSQRCCSQQGACSHAQAEIYIQLRYLTSGPCTAS
jgi:hypothetical protein